MKHTLVSKLAFTTSLVTVSLAGRAFGQDTTFTYQGRLEAANVPAHFDHGFLVRLFDAEGGGNQIGSTVCKELVDVVNGLFTLELDFGPAVGSESPRFLDIQVKEGGDCTDTTGYIQLLPRQRLTATPRASHALVAVQAESAGLAEHAGFADLAGAARRLDAPDGSPTSAVFVDNAGNVGIGTTSPLSRLHVKGPEEGIRIDGPFAGAANQAYLSFRTSSGSRIGYVGDGSDGDTNMFLASDSGDVILHTSAGRAFSVKANGQVGIGTTAPAAKLDVRGDIKLGTSGEFFAASGGENLRIVRGTVNANGTLNRGTGFSVSGTSGDYLITFTTPFSAPPSMTVTWEYGIGATPLFAAADNVGTSTAGVVLQDSSGLVRNGPFHFIAVGPR